MTIRGIQILGSRAEHFSNPFENLRAIEWIPYPKNFPPKEKKRYLTTGKDGRVWIDEWREYWRSTTDEAPIGDVIAFAELPEPYKVNP